MANHVRGDRACTPFAGHVTMTAMDRRLLAVALLFALISAACSSSDDPPAAADRTGPTAVDTSTTAPAAGEEATDAFRSDFYSEDHRWLCRPDLTDDVCDEDYDLTVIEADGSRSIEPFTAADDPSVDCFYVYPTVALDAAGNADIEDEDNAMEERAAANQLARFAEVCRVFAPLYRQASLGAITGAQVPDRDLAYADVVESFHHYLGQWNEGRPFVLIGHSQGSGLLSDLMAEEIDQDPALLDRLVSALLIGISVYAPPGEDVGSDYQNIPACRASDQTGCVMSYASYLATEDGTVDGFFGEHEAERHPICTNPGALEGGSADLDPIFAGDNPLQTASGGDPVDTPWVRYPSLVTVECITNDTHTYLAVTVNGDPSDPRIDDIGGDFLPGWGLHIIDVNLGISAMVDIAADQAEAF